MELIGANRPNRIEYRGQAIVAGSQLDLNLRFQVAPSLDATEVNWQGDISIGGTLGLMAGQLIDPVGRKNFELMAERLQNGLREITSGDLAPDPAPTSGHPDPDRQS